MAPVDVPLERLRFGQTRRRDAWWLQPLITFVVFTSFVVYATWALLQGDHYYFGNYLSPFYSPELFGNSPHAWFGPWRWPWLPFVHVLAGAADPASSRWPSASPATTTAAPTTRRSGPTRSSCAVGEPRNDYRGERKLPLILQNIHRYFLYFALIFLVLLAHDVWKALWFTDPATGHAKFGIGVGTLVLLVNVVLLGGYTLGCHSLRHLVGGFLDQLSRTPVRKTRLRLRRAASTAAT